MVGRVCESEIGDRHEICFVAGKDRISQTNRKDYKMSIDHVRRARACQQEAHSSPIVER